MIPFEATRPWPLTPLLIVLRLLVLFFVRSLSEFPKFQQRPFLIIHSMTLLLLTLVLTGFAWLLKTQYFIFLIDQSTSIPNNDRVELDIVLTFRWFAGKGVAA